MERPAIGSLWIEKAPRKRVYEVRDNRYHAGDISPDGWIQGFSCRYSKPRQHAEQTLDLAKWLALYEPFTPHEE